MGQVFTWIKNDWSAGWLPGAKGRVEPDVQSRGVEENENLDKRMSGCLMQLKKSQDTKISADYARVKGQDIFRTDDSKWFSATGQIIGTYTGKTYLGTWRNYKVFHTGPDVYVYDTSASLVTSFSLPFSVAAYAFWGSRGWFFGGSGQMRATDYGALTFTSGSNPGDMIEGETGLSVIKCIAGKSLLILTGDAEWEISDRDGAITSDMDGTNLRLVSEFGFFNAFFVKDQFVCVRYLDAYIARVVEKNAEYTFTRFNLEEYYPKFYNDGLSRNEIANVSSYDNMIVFTPEAIADWGNWNVKPYLMAMVDGYFCKITIDVDDFGTQSYPGPTMCSVSSGSNSIIAMQYKNTSATNKLVYFTNQGTNLAEGRFKTFPLEVAADDGVSLFRRKRVVSVILRVEDCIKSQLTVYTKNRGENEYHKDYDIVNLDEEGQETLFTGDIEVPVRTGFNDQIWFEYKFNDQNSGILNGIFARIEIGD